ncbi:MAG: serine hydrolase [bacterium]|nr:serine hydrolase [bacterium]
MPSGNAGGIASHGRLQFPIAPQQTYPFPQLRGEEFASPQVSARAVLVKDVRSGRVLFAKNESERLPIASLTKLLTALVVTARVSLEEMVEIESVDINVAAFKTNLNVSEKVLVKDLLAAMLVASANDAAMALARHSAGSVEDFVRFMNKEARRLKMVDTNFKNPVGFDDPDHFSTAQDLALLVEEFMTHSKLMRIVGQKEAVFYSLDNSRKHSLASTNKLLGKPQVLGIKTGYTNEAKGNIIILMEQPRYYFVVLGSANREADANALINWVEENFQWE